ncbi:MAG TPA: hypothetical protein DCK93_10090 [Blastocatellia bacterium]|nr:hypothetical protein [Blastocatellia bacterium]HAF23240.1 hypothetical protein [Blastocatellia bacterium]
MPIIRARRYPVQRADLDSAHGRPIAEGSVGGGAGTICYELKGGPGTALAKST